ncbi:tRNA 5-hydroxyuridine modification protein YegQ [Halothiobacillus sp. DCM-1]|uniref:prephenate-dependent tRNA uridine(34) hydroxylase TrhP n=1 Tax=Halothiobacillus sp. DCM-1 TaxID=3112558 RepID=UPI003243F2DF
MRAPELLSPAGTIKSMRYAFAYGADAVYAGLPRYSLRVRNNDFLEDNLRIGIQEAHAAGKKFFMTVNLSPHNAKLKTFIKDMTPLVEMQPDAFIMADPGLIMMVRQQWPDLPIHLSVQANTVNWAAVEFWKKIGVSRVILSRELSLDEIAEIRDRCPDTELEVFVHGALCIAYSGRCLLSGYFNHRDPNQGTCTNACRWEYKPSAAEADVAGVYRPAAEEILPLDAFGANGGGALDLSGSQAEAFGPTGADQRHPLADQVYFLEEPNRPGELMPIEEDQHGTYILNSRDLRAVEHVQALTRIGVDCLKIEGRTKSHYYVARTAQVYRRAIDDAVAGKPFDPSLIAELDNLAHRGYTDGFFERHHTKEYQNYLEGVSKHRAQQFVAEIATVSGDWAEVEIKNKLAVGDVVTFMLPEGNRDEPLADMQTLAGEPLQEAPGGGYRVRIRLPQGAGAQGDRLKYGLIARHLPA